MLPAPTISSGKPSLIPAITAAPMITFAQPTPGTAVCSAQPACTALGLNGNCCPNSQGMNLNCCGITTTLPIANISGAPKGSAAPNGSVAPTSPSTSWPTSSPSSSPTSSPSSSPSSLPSSLPSSSPSSSPTVKGNKQNNTNTKILTSAPPNDSCPLAITLPLDGTVTKGTTNQATHKGDDYPCSLNLCTGAATSRNQSKSPAVWYFTPGNGNIVEVSTCPSLTDFGTAIQVLTGDCRSPVCLPRAGVSTSSDPACIQSAGSDVGSLSSRVRIETDVGPSYNFLVYNRKAGNVTGNFGIHLDEIQTPPNDHYGAASLLVDRSKMNLGTTLNASIGSDFQCGAGGQVGVNNEAPGVWYTALGNGQTFELTTCASETDFDTAIQVFVGDCSQLRCVTRAGTDIDRNCSSSHSSRLSFDTLKGQLYYIYVFGRTSGDTGKFGFMLF